MKLKVKEGHAGIMTLNDGTQVNYGVKRVTQDATKMVYYTGKGLREMFKPDMNIEEQKIADQLKNLDEKALMKSGHIAEILLSDVKELK